jgi:hypothetical protein
LLKYFDNLTTDNKPEKSSGFFCIAGQIAARSMLSPLDASEGFWSL